MKLHMIKIFVLNSLLAGTITAMNQQQKDVNWHCPEHTQSKTALAALAMSEVGLAGVAAYVGLKNAPSVNQLLGNSDNTTAVTIVGGSLEQRLAALQTQQPNPTKCLRYFALSGLCLYGAGSTLLKIKNYQQYLQQRHAKHHCLTNHQNTNN